MNPYIKQYNEMIGEFDEKFGVAGPEKNSDSIGVQAGCDDCVANIRIRSEHKSFLLTSFIKGLESEVERLEDMRPDTRGRHGGQYGHPETDYKTGFNTCLDQEIQLRKEAISELKAITNN